MFEDLVEKVYQRLTKGSKKDERIRELWNALNHAYSTIQTYGNVKDYEANLNWKPPRYLRGNDYYSYEERLSDISHNSEMLCICAEDIRKVLFSNLESGPRF